MGSCLEHREVSAGLRADLQGGMGVGGGGKVGQEGRDKCTQISDSRHCTLQTNTTL